MSECKHEEFFIIDSDAFSKDDNEIIATVMCNNSSCDKKMKIIIDVGDIRIKE